MFDSTPKTTFTSHFNELSTQLQQLYNRTLHQKRTKILRYISIHLSITKKIKKHKRKHFSYVIQI